MKQQLRINDIVDNLLALSALRGDITGRGVMLVDNDDAALRQLIVNYVPAALTTAALQFVKTPEGWEVETDRVAEGVLTAWLTDMLLAKISGDDLPAPALADCSEIPPLTPHFP